MDGMMLPPVIQAAFTPLHAVLPAAQGQALQVWAAQRLAAAETGKERETETAVLTILELVPLLLQPEQERDDEGVIDAPVIRLFKNLAWLSGQPAPRSHKPLRRALQTARTQGDTAVASQILIEILHAYG